MNYDLEKQYHPENYEDAPAEEAHDILDTIESIVFDLDKWSVYNNDILNDQVYKFNELIRESRKQLS